jgi:hypothetical protein
MLYTNYLTLNLLIFNELFFCHVLSNILLKYQYNLEQANRKLKNNRQIQHQITARKNSTEISSKLSCWIMKFNDVLNSVGTEPEIFDCVIVDEASQLDFSSLILGYYAKNMIIVGDDKQTSPSALSGVEGNDFESIKNKHLDYLGDDKLEIRSDNSLFTLSKMVAGSSNLALKEHFRCVSEIIEFSKYNFYDNSLKPLKQINTENRLEPIKAIFIQNSFIEDRIVYAEIESIKNHLIEIINNPLYKNKTIGVVSLGSADHTRKLKEIKEDLSEIFDIDKLDEIKLIIEDSPKFQGDERDVMLVSLGVALDSEKLKFNGNPMPRAIVDDGKMKDELKKINVALSRAKEQMILFHSVKSENLKNDKKTKDFRLKILSFFYGKFKKIVPFDLPDDEDERTTYNRPDPFDSWFEYDIARELIEKGFPYIQPQYRVKEDETFYNHYSQKETYVNFKLDLVVSNNGKMIAIECDGDPFHSLPEDVAYDVERQEFLERVGWKVFRILYSKYKRNPTDEIEKMVSFIEKHTKKDKIIPFTEVLEEITTEETEQEPFAFLYEPQQSREHQEPNGSLTVNYDFTKKEKIARKRKYILLFSKLGKCYWLQSINMPDTSQGNLLKSFQQQVPLQSPDKIIAFIMIPDLNDKKNIKENCLIFCTKKGYVKKMSLDNFSNPRSKGVKALTILEGDHLFEVKLANNQSEMLLANKNGRIIRFSTYKIRHMSRAFAGVKGMIMDDQYDEIISLMSFDPTDNCSHIFAISNNGKGKLSYVQDYPSTNRGGKGVKSFNVSSYTGQIVAVKSVYKQDNVLITTEMGRLVSKTVSDMKVLDRSSQEINIIDLEENDSVSEVYVTKYNPSN